LIEITKLKTKNEGLFSMECKNNKMIGQNIVIYFLLFAEAFQYALSELTDPFRYQSVLSLIVASILAPLSIWETFIDALPEKFRLEMHFFYIAYCLADIYHGQMYYPQYFPFLEGWFHHLLTGGYVAYSVYQNQLRPCCVGMIVEVPSIILFASRVFRGNETVAWCKEYIYPPLFILFRLTFLTYFAWEMKRQDEIGWVGICLTQLFLVLNIYWICQIYKKVWIRVQDRL